MELNLIRLVALLKSMMEGAAAYSTNANVNPERVQMGFIAEFTPKEPMPTEDNL